MKKILLYLLSIPCACSIYTTPAIAQLKPDRTLGGQKSIVNQINSSRQEINGGAARGSQLFHSFEEFNVNTGKSVYFNAPGISNIFTRVTGNNPSNIFGTLGVIGNGNLFLINPNGIIFNESATLDINGSFVGTTAEFVSFGNGFKFSSVNPQLVQNGIQINFPLNFGFGAKSSPIIVENQGHDLFKSPFQVQLAEDLNPKSGIQVRPSRTLALMGSDIFFNGGIVKAKEGQILLGSIKQGTVSFNPLKDTNHQWLVDYQKASNYGNIKLSNKSLLDISSQDLPISNRSFTTALNKALIDIKGENIELTNGTVLLSQSIGSSTFNREIKLVASNYLEISDNSSNSFADRNIKGGILSENFGDNLGTNIWVDTKNLQISNARIFTTNFGDFPNSIGGNINIKAQNAILERTGNITTQNASTGRAGNIKMDVAGRLQINGVTSPLDNVNSSIASVNISSGTGGDISVSAQNIEIKNGGSIGSNLIFGTGNAGNVTINVDKRIRLTGQGSFFRLPGVSARSGSRIISQTFSQGNGGNVDVNASEILVENGAEINTSTAGIGNAGILNLNSLEKIIVNNATIKASTDIPSQSQRQGLEFFGFTSEALGSSGIIILKTKELSIINGGTILASNETVENAGNIFIDADKITLNRGRIIAEAREGNGGNIKINTKYLGLFNNSQISANVGFIDDNGVFQGNGDGGNIFINAQDGVVLNLDRSSITANATLGRGGNIRIVAAGLFVTPGVKIEAISQLGIDGVIEIDLETNTQSLIPLTRQSYQEYVDEVNLRCENQNKQDPASRFGIKNTFPHKEFLEGGDWEFYALLTTSEEALDRDSWREVIRPNAIIKGTNGEIYHGLVCARRVGRSR